MLSHVQVIKVSYLTCERLFNAKLSKIFAHKMLIMLPNKVLVVLDSCPCSSGPQYWLRLFKVWKGVALGARVYENENAEMWTMWLKMHMW